MCYTIFILNLQLDTSISIGRQPISSTSDSILAVPFRDIDFRPLALSSTSSSNPSDVPSDNPEIQNVFGQIRRKKSTRQIPIWGTDVRDYIQGDNTKHAFAKFYQSWKNTILDTFKISDKEFDPTYKETPGFIIVTVFSPESASTEILGYILFDKNRGIVEIVNANSQLHPWAFKIALLSKDYKGPTLVGDNTTNFRHAVMAMVHKGYKVHMESNCYIFNFQMNGLENLTCRMTSSRKEPPGNPDKHLLTYTSRIGKDVIIRIGPVFGLGGSRVPKDEFISWLGVAISIRHLWRPSELIETEYGDIILDPIYANKIYHNGVLSQDTTFNGETFQYGYNFHREGQESVFLSIIWETAIQQKPEVALQIFIDLLWTNTSVSDTKEADELFEFSTAEMIWNRLLAGAGQELFYYCNEQGSDQAEVIKEHLGKYPTPIPSMLWNLLRRHSLIRTVDEERNCHPKDPDDILPKTTFSKTIQRVLEAGLMLGEDTKEIKILFVNIKDRDIDLQCGTEQNVLEVSNKWLCFDTIHKQEPCAVTSTMDPDNLGSNFFICDHIAESLLEIVLYNLGLGNLVRGWRRRFVEKLRQMPREITAEQGPNAKEIVITWKDGATHLFSTVCGKNIQYHVTLHEAKCWNKSVHLLHESGIHETDLAPCGCIQKLVSQESKTVTFGDLDPSREYFPMVAENGDLTFYGIPHEPIRPSEHSKLMELDKKRDDIKSSTQNDTDDLDLEEVSALEALETLWESWQRESFPLLWSKCTPRYSPVYEVNIRPFATLESRRLKWRFETDDFVIVMIKHPQESKEHSCYLLYLHGNLPPVPNAEGDEGSLVATQFSFLHESPIFGLEHVMEKNTDIYDKEVLLHFHDFRFMGEKNDATIVPIKDIINVKQVEIDLLGPSERLVYTRDIPSDLFVQGLFCRFAVRCGPEDSACLTPVASHLLPLSQHWAKPRYIYQPQPVILDLSPGVVGLAEGFRQSGCVIHAGVGFSPESHLTWRATYPAAETYNGQLQEVLSDFKSFGLSTNPSGISDVPTIGVLSIPNKVITMTNEQMGEYLKILDYIQNIVDVQPKKLDFLVLTFPSWVFCKEANQHLFNSIYNLLRQRYCIHLKNVVFSQHGIPQDGTGVILLASSVYSEAHWNELFDKNIERDATVTVKDCIHDLAFRNPRIGHETDHLVCRHPNAGINVYNHKTGKTALPRPLNWDSLATISHCPYRTQHPERGDMLTVREVARIQGFPDSFIFFGSNKRQYEEVVTSFPPPISKKIADMVMSIVQEFCSLPDEGDSSIGEALRSRKRCREGF